MERLLSAWGEQFFLALVAGCARDWAKQLNDWPIDPHCSLAQEDGVLRHLIGDGDQSIEIVSARHEAVEAIEPPIYVPQPAGQEFKLGVA